LSYYRNKDWYPGTARHHFPFNLRSAVRKLATYGDTITYGGTSSSLMSEGLPGTVPGTVLRADPATKTDMHCAFSSEPQVGHLCEATVLFRKIQK